MAGRKSKRWAVLSAAALAAIAGNKQASAASFYWVGDNTSTWSTNDVFGSNWSNASGVNNDPFTIPGSTDDVFFYLPGAFASPVNTTLGQNFSIKSLTFLATDTQSVTIGGANNLTIGTGGLSVLGGAATNLISANVVLGANQAWANNGAALTVSGVISGTGTLTTSGLGTLNLTNANTYTGGLTLSTAGNVVSLSGAGSATSVSSITLNGGATLNLDSTVTNSNNRLGDTVTLNSGGGTFNLLGNAAVATTETLGTLNLNSGLTNVNVSGFTGGGVTFGSGAISSVTRAKGGSVNFSVAAGTTVNLPNITPVNGILGGYATIGSVNGAFGASVDWAALDGSKNVVAYTAYNPNFTTAAATDNVQLSTVTSLSGSTNTYSINSLYINGAGGGSNSLIWSTNTANTSPKIIVGAGGILVNGVTGQFQMGGTEPAFTNAAVIGVSPLPGTNNGIGTQGLPGGTITAGPGANYELIVTTANGANLRLADVITNNGTNPVTLVKNGNGVLDLGLGNDQTNVTSNTFTGKIIVNGGQLQVNGDLNLGANLPSVVSDYITLNGATLRTTRTFTFSVNRGVVVGSQGGTLFYSGGSTWTLGQPISGPGGITFNSLAGNNIQIRPPVTGTANSFTYQGATTLNASNGGTIHIASNDPFPHNSALTVSNLGGGNPADFANGAGPFNITVGSLAGNDGITGNNGVFTMGQNNLSTLYSGVLAGSGSVVKNGIGTQTFSGNNSYSGSTTVNAGKLLITGAPTATGTSALYTVGTAGSLGGSGTIAAPVIISGALAPATSATQAATLTINNNVTFNNGALLNYLFGFGGNDSLIVNGAGTSVTLLSGATSDVLNINNGTSFGVGTYTLIQASNGATFTDNATFVINGSTAFNYALSFTNGANGSLVLTVTPGNPTLTWSGSVDNNWNTTTTNWKPGSSIWANGDNAVFNNTGSNTSIVVTGAGVTPNTLLWDNATVNYSFSGGAINVGGTNPGTITKNQIGTVTLSNSVTGGVVNLNGGTVTVAVGGTLNSSSLNVGTPAFLNVNGTLGTTVLQADGTVTFNQTSAASTTFTTLNGAGNVTFGSNTTLVLAGGAFAGSLNGGGNLTINSATGQNFTSAGLNYTGTTKILSGGLIPTSSLAAGSAIQVGNTSGTASASILTGGPITVNRDLVVTAGNTGVMTVGGSTGDTSTYTGNVFLNNTNSATVFVTGAGGTVNYTGNVSGAGGVNYQGPGTTVFGGSNNTYTGATVVNTGILQVNGGFTSSSLTVNAGGTFNANGVASTGTGTITLNTNAPLANGAIYSNTPGTLNVNTTGALGSTNLVINGGVISLNATNATPYSGFNLLNNSTLNIGSTNTVTFASGGISLTNSTLSFSSTNSTPSSTPVSVVIGTSGAGLTNLPLNGSQVRSKFGTVADLSSFNISTAAPTLVAGLKEGLLASGGNIDNNAPAPLTGIIRTGPVQGNVMTDWPLQATYVYTGQILVNNTNGDGTGTIAFGESFDDAVLVKIDGLPIINDGTYNLTTAAIDRLTAGWHNIEIRFGQGGGGVGPVQDANGWGPGAGSNGLGFGYTSNGASLTGGVLNGANYLAPVETGVSSNTATLFRTIATGGGVLTVDDGSTLIVGSVSGASSPTLNFGSGTNGSIFSFAAHTSTVASTLNAISVGSGAVSTINVGASNVVTAAGLNIGATATFSATGAGTLSVPSGVTVQGTLNYAGTTLVTPSITVSTANGAVANPSALASFAQGSSFTNSVNVIGAGFALINGTTSATSNLISGPINLSNSGGIALEVEQQPGTNNVALVNTYNGRINVTGSIGSNGADAVLQVRDNNNQGTNGTIGVGVFTNIHLGNGSGLNFGLIPSAPNNRDHAVIDLNLDGTSAFISGNSEGQIPSYIRNVTSTNAGAVLTLFANNSTAVANMNSVLAVGQWTALGAKTMNAVGSLSPNVTLLNTETTAAGGLLLTSETNIASAFTLNGGTVETAPGALTTLTANATPGTSGTFLVDGNQVAAAPVATLTLNRSADATITLNGGLAGGVLNINKPQNLVAFNVNTSFTSNTNSLTIGTLSVSASANLNVSATTVIAAKTVNLNNSTIQYSPASDATLNLGVISDDSTALYGLGGGGGTPTMIGSGLITGQVNTAGNPIIDVPATKTLTLSGGLSATDLTKGPLGGTLKLNMPTPLNLNSLTALGGTASIGTAFGAPVAWGPNSATINPGANIGTLTVNNNATVAFANTVGSGNPFLYPSFTGTFGTRITHSVGTLVLPYTTSGSTSFAAGQGGGGGSITPSGTLDIGSHQVLINTPNASDVENIRLLVAAGYNATAYGNEDGAWDGPGITSSVAKSSYDPNALASKFVVGYAYGGDQSVQLEQGGGASGNNFNLDGIGVNQTLVRSVLLGDVNMDGVVDFNDIGQVLGFAYNLNTPAHYTDGDIANHGIVNFDDIGLVLAYNFNSGLNFPSQNAAQAQSKFSAMKAAAATATLTGRTSVKGAASPASTTVGVAGDGKPDFIYNPSTGDVVFVLDGYAPKTNASAASFINAVNLTSAHGLFIPGNANSTMSQGSGVTLTTSTLASAFSSGPGYGDGVSTFSFDIGNVLPTGMLASDLVNELTLKYGILNNGGTVRTSDIIVPEPTSLALAGLGVIGLLGRRRKRTQKV